MIDIRFDGSFDAWRVQARDLASKKILPESINWNSQELSFGNLYPANSSGRHSLKVPKDFIDLAKTLSYARAKYKWDLLYRILYRLNFENANLLHISVDSDIRQAQLLQKSIKRDIHKMHAFVRFKKVSANDHEQYVAWHNPEHLIVRPASHFFVKRFGDKPWSIYTPDESAHWNLEKLSFGPGKAQHEFQLTDSWDELWKTYYSSIYNPARLNLKAMRNEMSPKYWASMPETALIKELVRKTPQSLERFKATQAQPIAIDPRWSLEQLKKEALQCKACPLFQKATQTVFGEGNPNAGMMIVGEQPGDKEDLAGRPFYGPAGELLHQSLEQLQINRSEIYFTNAVKHFKWQPDRSGKKRIHQSPRGSEMATCQSWLEAEITRVNPKLIVALGLTAATSVLGIKQSISELRGQVIQREGKSNVIVSWHPAAILRSRTEEEKNLRWEQLSSDLKLAKENV